MKAPHFLFALKTIDDNLRKRGFFDGENRPINNHKDE